MQAPSFELAQAKVAEYESLIIKTSSDFKDHRTSIVENNSRRQARIQLKQLKTSYKETMASLKRELKDAKRQRTIAKRKEYQRQYQQTRRDQSKQAK